MADSSFKVVSGDKFIVDHGGAAAAANVGLYVAGTKVLGVQGATVANAASAAVSHTQLNLLLAELRTHGIIATT